MLCALVRTSAAARKAKGKGPSGSRDGADQRTARELAAAQAFLNDMLMGRVDDPGLALRGSAIEQTSMIAADEQNAVFQLQRQRRRNDDPEV
jgi:hypothetical protein